MTLEWIRFWITAVCFLGAALSFLAEVLGVWRFGYVMNRMHAAGIGDTMGFFLVAAGLVVSANSFADVCKLVLLVFFLWFSSPASTHFLGQVEYFTNQMAMDEIPVRKLGSTEEAPVPFNEGEPDREEGKA